MSEVTQALQGVASAVKPRLRGWLHAGAAPLAVAAGIVLVAIAPTGRAKIACAVYAVTSVMLFTVSAVYHRGRWSPRTRGVLRRLDHANIFLIIAGTYTPVAALVLPDHRGTVLLSAVWGLALAGVLFRVLWVSAPRWLFVPAYVLLGWAAAWVLPDLLHSGGWAVTVLLAAGGAVYSVGGLIYAVRRPDPSPRWFGYHEVFHALTLVAFTSQFVAVGLVVR